MTVIMGVDQSLSKCGMLVMKDGQPDEHRLSKTGKATVKTKRKDTTYYETLQEQIHHICEDFIDMVEEYQPEVICFEALSFGSVGSASRDLSCLYGAMRERLLISGYKGVVTETPPTALKSFAWNYLSEEDRWEGTTKANRPKKTKMDKKLMVKAVREIYGQDYLAGYNYSTGLDDLADATFLAHKYWSENCVDGKDVQNQ